MAFRVTILVFNGHEILNPIFIQFVVALTTFLMVIRFGLDALRHRSRSNAMKVTLIIMDAVTQPMIIYSLGIMQRPSGKNSYYQVWAVLLVTLRYSVKIGRPSGIELKQTPLVDLMSSFWAANILRSQAMKILKVTGWLLWSVNSLRIIHGFLSSEFANNSHRENMRLLTDYMRLEHRVGQNGDQIRPDPSTMKGYRYLVLGESKKQKKKKEADTGTQASRVNMEDMKEETENIRRLVLALRDEDKKMVTLEKIWRGNSDVLDEELKDLCLSFALYKLLRRRFFNFGIHEEKVEKTRRLVLEGILGIGESSNSANSPNFCGLCCNSACMKPLPEAAAEDAAAAAAVAKSKRAFRVIEAEVAFLNDFFNSRHAIIFANGFPITRLVLSTVLLGGIAGMAVAIHRFSKVAKVDELGNVHHGVVFTWILLSFLGVKEIWEIITSVFSDWTKIILLCKYVQKPWWLRGWAAKAFVGKFCRCSVWPRWHGKIGQCNLLFPTSFLLTRRRSMYLVDLSDEVKSSVIKCLSDCLRMGPKLKLNDYIGLVMNSLEQQNTAYQKLRNIVWGAGDDERVVVSSKKNQRVVEVDVQTLLVWHIATCYCEIAFRDARGVRVSRLSSARAFAQRQEEEGAPNRSLWSDYMVARTLSQYCAYVLTLVPPLVSGNSLMASSVKDEVYREKMRLFFSKGKEERCDSSTGILEMLKEYASGEDDPDSKEKGEGDPDSKEKGEEDPDSKEKGEEDPGSKEKGEEDPGSKERRGEDAGSEIKKQEDATIFKRGAVLGKKLVEAFPPKRLAATGGDGGEAAESRDLEAEHLWKFLSEFWAGFVIYMARSTRASQHKIFLSSGGELMTHLWALLSNAGDLGEVQHGDQDIQTVQAPADDYFHVETMAG